MEIISRQFPNLGWLEYKLNEEQLDYVWKSVDNQKEDHKKDLAGNITGSYLLDDKDDWFFKNVLTPLANTYSKEFRNHADKVPINQRHPYYMSTWWVNYQKQTEFNPMHCHTGVYSFALWLKIPTSHFEQNMNPISLNSNAHKISAFEFSYTDILGTIFPYNYEMSPKLEGTMLFFPSELKHCVYPFYNCEDDRVSVAGNLQLDTTKTC